MRAVPRPRSSAPKKEVTIQGLPFTLKHVSDASLFGTRNVWRGKTRVPVTGPAKTVVDMLDDPAIGGGIRHVADCLRGYLAREHANADELIAAADKLGNARYSSVSACLPNARADRKH